MADIELVIKIPEELKNKIDNANEDNYRTYIWWFDTTLYCAIKDGTPLPKGHGKIIDVSEYFKKEFGDAREFLDKATTIIEADTESEGQIVMTFSEMKQAILQAFIDNDDTRLQRLKIMDSNMYAEVIKALEMDVVKAEEALNG